MEAVDVEIATWETDSLQVKPVSTVFRRDCMQGIHAHAWKTLLYLGTAGEGDFGGRATMLLVDGLIKSSLANGGAARGSSTLCGLRYVENHMEHLCLWSQTLRAQAKGRKITGEELFDLLRVAFIIVYR